MLVEVATERQGQLTEGGFSLHQTRHRQRQFTGRLVTDQGIALDGDPFQIRARIIETAGDQFSGDPRRFLITGQTHLSLYVPFQARIEPRQIGGIEIRIQSPRLLAEAALGLQPVGTALQRQSRDLPLHLVVAAELALDGERILIKLALDFQLGQLQLPVTRLAQLETADYLARQLALEFRHQFGGIDLLEFGGALPANPLVPGQLAIELELPLQGVEQQVYLVELFQIPLARQRQLEGGHIRAFAGGIQGKLVGRELALGGQAALVQLIAGLVLGCLFGDSVQGPAEALPLQRQVKRQVRVEGSQ